MKLALVNLTSGGLSGGYRKYLHKMIPLLRAHSALQSLDVFLHKNLVPEFSSVHDRISSWSLGEEYIGYPWLRREIRQLNVDVVFIPTGRTLILDSIPVAIMMRNMEPLLGPFEGNPLSERLRNVLRSRNMYQSCKRANRVIAVSKYVRDFLVNSWNIEPQKVGMVYHGTEPTINPLEPVPVGREVPPRFFFTAGSIRPARGLEDLFRALTILKNASKTYHLMIAGKVDPGMSNYHRALRQLVETLGLKEQVKWLGPLDASSMALHFSRAIAFVMTSRAEACPNIALEAMSCGSQVVSTRQPPMPEFFRDTAVFYTPGKSEELAVQLDVMANRDHSQVKEARETAKLRAADFTWSKTVENTVEELNIAVQGPNAQ
jgi:glycosyltransferase involved in cell wall biosynthesis